jgi:transcriptional regulator with PAS, ATPase and Fis domain
MRRLIDAILLITSLDAPVLIEGETGTGKDLVARALHACSERAARPFVTIDCGGLPESLAESELFGHSRGAFTGADREYAGRIQAAADSTLFLDEVNSLSLAMQAKILRFLELREIWRVGLQRPVHVNARLVAASNVPVDDLVASGRMRADFAFRMNVLRLELPPLRERLEDLPLLVSQFLQEDQLALRFGVTGVCAEVMEQLYQASWPGNVRELRNVLRRSILLHPKGGDLRQLDWKVAPAAGSNEISARPTSQARMTFRSWMREREREYLTELIRRYPTITDQATISGLPQRTLYRKLRHLRSQVA